MVKVGPWSYPGADFFLSGMGLLNCVFWIPAFAGMVFPVTQHQILLTFIVIEIYN